MFLHLSVILFTGGGGLSVAACITSHMTGGSVSRGISVQSWVSLSKGGLCPRGLSGMVQGGFCSGGLCQGDPHTVTYRQYASYWNAFLFCNKITDLY